MNLRTSFLCPVTTCCLIELKGCGHWTIHAKSIVLTLPSFHWILSPLRQNKLWLSKLLEPWFKKQKQTLPSKCAMPSYGMLFLFFLFTLFIALQWFTKPRLKNVGTFQIHGNSTCPLKRWNFGYVVCTHRQVTVILMTLTVEIDDAIKGLETGKLKMASAVWTLLPLLQLSVYYLPLFRPTYIHVQFYCVLVCLIRCI